MVEVKVEGGSHMLARYRVEVDGPRPGLLIFQLVCTYLSESYSEDFEEASKLPEGQRKNW